MAAPAVAARLLAVGGVRKWLGCGCVALVAIVALPTFMLMSVMSGVLSGITGGAAGGNQVDQFAAGSAAVVVGTAQPIERGRFTVSQGFGCTTLRSEPVAPRPYQCPPDAAHSSAVRFHTGIDLAAAHGVPVFSVAPGVIRVVRSGTGFGLHILLAPAVAAPATTSVTYLYGHLSDTYVPDGTMVAAGQVIGFVGSSGNSTGPHLHFEVDVGGVPVNPCSVFPNGYLTPSGVAATGCVAWA
ncbi:MAG: M23 family metallopeptidase [Candidatus Dormibacteraeota bacterium]|uniref:M23 family metallopeptidase n=1 Tax=Candidatus Amunia macphersoniae TaxID=3127014 RepID=A0A934KKW1_9BACT|nr:M23 family metallopeptidase [Candidatus Dormibacteraeota bacterium]